jgi:hypothetical protein
MIISRNLLSDIEIICLIEHNNFLGWQCLYNKYALMMYVSIFWITNNKILTEEIMSLLFVQLKSDKTLLNTRQTLSTSLLHHSYTTAYKILKINEMRSKRRKVQLEPCPILTDLMNNAISITEAEAKDKLRSNINKIKDKYSKKTKEQTTQKQKAVFDFGEK